MNSNKSLLILTSSFPFEGGEQFIENEAPYWEALQFTKTYILPNTSNGSKRWVPNNIEVLTEKLSNSLISKVFFVLLTLFQNFFYKELVLVFKENKKNFFSKALIALKNGANILRQQARLKKTIKKHPEITTIYNYWNDVTSYASCLIDNRIKVISRAHRFDLYKERRNYEYMPYKKQFLNSFSTIYLLSDKAKKYYQHTYFTEEYSCKLKVSRLGVKIPKPQTLITPPQNNKLNILSLSYCVPVKRIDKIFNALLLFSQENPNVNINWTHIGGGDLLNQFLDQACSINKQYENLNIIFKGQMSNKKVLHFLSSTNNHAFINSSESEGMPVSIMEAMSYNIPIVAPDVGDISDIVKTNFNGVLLSEKCAPEEISQALSTILLKNNWAEYSCNSYQLANKLVNAEINFRNFVHELNNLI